MGHNMPPAAFVICILLKNAHESCLRANGHDNKIRFQFVGWCDKGPRGSQGTLSPCDIPASFVLPQDGWNFLQLIGGRAIQVHSRDIGVDGKMVYGIPLPQYVNAVQHASHLTHDGNVQSIVADVDHLTVPGRTQSVKRERRMSY